MKACPIKIEILLEPVTAITCLQSKAARKLASKVPWECWAKGLKSWSPFRSVSSPLAPVGTAHTGPQGLWGSAQRVLSQRGISPSKFELCFTILHVTPPSLLASCFEYSRQNATRMLYRERNALNDLGSMPQNALLQINKYIAYALAAENTKMPSTETIEKNTLNTGSGPQECSTENKLH